MLEIEDNGIFDSSPLSSPLLSSLLSSLRTVRYTRCYDTIRYDTIENHSLVVDDLGNSALFSDGQK